MYHVANNTKRYLSFPMSMKDKVSTEVISFYELRPFGPIRFDIFCSMMNFQ